MLQAGQIVHGRYQLQKQLRHAANRQTWLAKDLATPLHSLVIVKILSFVGEVQWEVLKLFEREAQVLQQLDHSRIPQYRDYFCLDERSLQFALIQEYIPGSSLQELLQQGKKFTEPQIYQIAFDVLHILIYLHELNPPILHRDIKPSQLIWGENQQIYLVDFGTVQSQPALLGASFTIVGTYGYTPLEQFGGKAVPASDLYALGTSLIHLVTGVPPADLPQRNLQIQFTEFVSLSPKLVSWLQQLSAPAVERRFCTARLALASLESKLVLHSSSPIDMAQASLSNLSVPEEIKGWNWGAFLLAPLWLVSHRVWVGLFALVPIVGFWMAIALGIKGNEWAWKKRRWESINQFRTHQRRWAIAGIIFGLSINLLVWHMGVLLLLSTLISS